MSLTGMMAEVASAIGDGITAVVLFPAVADELKSPGAEECFNPRGLVPRAVRMLKEKWPFLVVVTDVALDPYNSDGHDGIVDARPGHGVIVNDATVDVLCKQAVCQVGRLVCELVLHDVCAIVRPYANTRNIARALLFSRFACGFLRGAPTGTRRRRHHRTVGHDGRACRGDTRRVGCRRVLRREHPLLHRKVRVGVLWTVPRGAGNRRFARQVRGEWEAGT